MESCFFATCIIKDPFVKKCHEILTLPFCVSMEVTTYLASIHITRLDTTVMCLPTTFKIEFKVKLGGLNGVRGKGYVFKIVKPSPPFSGTYSSVMVAACAPYGMRPVW